MMNYKFKPFSKNIIFLDTEFSHMNYYFLRNDLRDKKFLKIIGVDTSKFKHTHNALDDAKLLKEVYIKLQSK